MGGTAQTARSGAARVRTGALAAVAALVAASGAQAAFAALGPLGLSGLNVIATSPTAASSSDARTDPALLKLTTAAPVAVMIKLHYASTASYRGGVAGLRATSPAVTGRRLSLTARAVRRYGRYQRRVEGSTVAALRQIPGFRLGRSLRVVYGGISARVPGNEIADVLKTPGVVAVQRDSIRYATSDASNTFIGSPVLWAQLHSDPSNAGEGILFGDIDTGVWPENPMLADQGNLPAPPPKLDGTPRVCDFGPDPTSTSTKPFACNHKVISGQAFLDTYNLLVGDATYRSARDSEGHGTHTTTTAAGDHVDHADLFGVDRGPVGGIAPGAWVASYKVLGSSGGFTSDIDAGIQQAILDGVDVINYSIGGGGGENPYTDPTDLAFLDAYAAGVFVSASAGNDGPAPATAGNLAPWITTVGASTLNRSFGSTITVTAGDASVLASGVSVGLGLAVPTPIVLAGATAPYDDPYCTTEALAGTFAGKVVICLRGGPGAVGRIQKGFNVLQGGAVGMVLVNPVAEDVETDNHFLPTIHLDKAAGDRVIAFVTAHPDAVTTFLQGVERPAQGDVMAAFSSRGPGGLFLKPDLTAPGVQILAGNTPLPDNVDSGAPGQFFQAIAGTSMAAPHVAGGAILVAALHPDWGPGQIKSALMTTATTDVVKEDTTTPADPFDDGAGRIDLTQAGSPGLTISETAANYAAQATKPDSAAIDLNVPSFNAPVFPGSITAARRLKSVKNYPQRFSITTTAPSGARILVTPSRFVVPAYGSRTIWIHITAHAIPEGQYFGSVEIRPDALTPGPALHLPVAFYKTQGETAVAQTCSPLVVRIFTGPNATTCTVHVENTGLEPTTATATTDLGSKLKVRATGGGATAIAWNTAQWTGSLAPRQDAAPGIAPTSGDGDPGYNDLTAAPFNIAPTPVGDEDLITLTTPSFVYAGRTYTTLSVTSDGYAVAGGANSAQFIPQHLPDPSPPNNVLAPFWTDLTGDGAPGITNAILTDGTNDWLVVQWDLNTISPEPVSARTFQLWIGLNGTEDITYTYDPARLPAAPADAAAGLTVGAENAPGTAGAQLPFGTAPTSDLRVASTPGAPGGSVDYTVTGRGIATGLSVVDTGVVSSNVRGKTTVQTNVTVTRR